jgi:hypothetical protein
MPNASCNAAVVAVRLVLRDQGNGVVRLEAAELLDGVCFGGLWCPLAFPPSLVVVDFLEVARPLVGLSPCHAFREGRCRPVSDDVREYCVW